MEKVGVSQVPYTQVHTTLTTNYCQLE
jgi:hypothetical protein